MAEFNDLKAFWSLQPAEVFSALHSSATGLDNGGARLAKKVQSYNNQSGYRFTHLLLLLLRQFKSPLTIMLVAAAVVSFYLNDRPDAYIIGIVVLISGLLGFWQEAGASAALSKLLAMVNIMARVIRNGHEADVPVAYVVAGDIILLNAGDIVPCDGLIIESNSLFVDESTLTGETFPVEKATGVLPAETILSKRTNAVFMGSHIVTGTAKIIAVHTGNDTIFGGLSKQLKTASPETDFEKGIRRFGYMLMEITMLLIMAILTVNILLKKQY